jgi:inosine/xanthosine triphosphatase
MAYRCSCMVCSDGGLVHLRVSVGSTNPVKIAAAAEVLRRIYGAGVDVESVAVESGVPVQPWGNDETLRGALNRARASRSVTSATLGVGFEGGLLEVGGHVFTCAWCAVAREDGVEGLAGGESVLLPPAVAADVRAGMELGPAMDVLTGLQDTKHGRGAIGELTGGWLDRQTAYEHLLTLALARLLKPGYYRAIEGET